MLQKRAKLSEILLNVHQEYIVPLDHQSYNCNKNIDSNAMKNIMQSYICIVLFLSNHAFTLFRFVLNSLKHRELFLTSSLLFWIYPISNLPTDNEGEINKGTKNSPIATTMKLIGQYTRQLINV